MKRSTKMTKALAVLLSLLMVIGTFTIMPLTASAVEAPGELAPWDGTASSWPLPGLGTKEDPYQIASPSDYYAMVINDETWHPAGKTYFVLTADLNMNNIEQSGVSFNGSKPLTIHLDGQNHKIYNMKTQWGMFEMLGEGTEIKNLHMIGFSSLFSSRGRTAAGIALENRGATLIENVSFDSTSVIKSTSATGANVGGYITNIRANITFKDCITAATVSGGNWIGGFAGTTHTGLVDIKFENCLNAGAVSSATGATGDVHVGGFLGGAVYQPKTFTMINCANTGAISAYSTKADGSALGGLVGSLEYYTSGSNTHSQDGTVTLTKCYNSGTVHNYATFAYTGGVVGYFRFGGTANCTNVYNVGTVENPQGGALALVFGSGTGGELTKNFSYVLAEEQEKRALHGLSSNLNLSNCGTVGVGELNAETIKIDNMIKYGIEINPTTLKLNTASNLNMALKIKEPFGFMAISKLFLNSTAVDAGNYISNKLAVGFVFLKTAEPLTVDALLASDEAIWVAGEEHADGTRFLAKYEELNVSNVDETIYFTAAIWDARTGELLVKGDKVCNITPYEKVVEGSKGQINGTTIGADEKAVYQSIVDYKVAYNEYLVSVGGQKKKVNYFDVVSYNILGCRNYEKDPGGKVIDPDAVVDVLYGFDAEVIALCEVDINTDRSIGSGAYKTGGSNQPKYIAEQLTAKTGVQHYWAFSVDLNGWIASAGNGKSMSSICSGGWVDPAYTNTNQALYGNALISRYPIVDCRQIQFWSPDHSAQGFSASGTGQVWVAQHYKCSSKTGHVYKEENGFHGDYCTLTTEGHNDICRLNEGTSEAPQWVDTNTEACCSKHSKGLCATFGCKGQPVSAFAPCKVHNNHETVTYERKSALIADLDVNGTIVTVISTHYGLRPSEQVVTTQAIIKEMEKCENPVILAGDLNSGFTYNVHSSDNDLALLMQAGLNANVTPATLPVTFHSGSTIDFIMTTKEFTADIVRSVITNVSDHYPIYTRVALS